jgi:hypothetical protein
MSIADYYPAGFKEFDDIDRQRIDYSAMLREKLDKEFKGDIKEIQKRVDAYADVARLRASRVSEALFNDHEADRVLSFLDSYDLMFGPGAHTI